MCFLTNIYRQSDFDFYDGFSDDVKMSATKHKSGLYSPEILTLPFTVLFKGMVFHLLMNPVSFRVQQGADRNQRSSTR